MVWTGSWDWTHRTIGMSYFQLWAQQERFGVEENTKPRGLPLPTPGWTAAPGCEQNICFALKQLQEQKLCCSPWQLCQELVRLLSKVVLIFLNLSAGFIFQLLGFRASLMARPKHLPQAFLGSGCPCLSPLCTSSKPRREKKIRGRPSPKLFPFSSKHFPTW